MSDLKPCPICGRMAFISHDIVDGFDFGWSVGCPEACIGDKFHGLNTLKKFEKAKLVMSCLPSRSEAIDAWNKRCEDGVAKMAELKPCPFCGRIPTVEDCGDNRWFIRCKCGIAQDKLYFQRCSAIRAWNRRKGE